MSIRFFGIMTASFVATAALIGGQAPAQVIRNHNSNAPVNFSAGAIELQDRTDRVILTGGVTATQAGLSMSASRLTAAYSSGGGIDVHRLDAVGGVTITKDDLRAKSDAAIYDLDSDLITLLGNVQLTQGANRLNGGRIVIDLNSGRSTISGGGTPAAPGIKSSGGRVTGTFTVPQRKN
ncbi:LptA/OstA family protein [Sphingorhabdus sp.]|jgi:lipopolysaccharide export system protein LptA|uniref:LptA/OstA family protein n=1 Tax=Sphingorhabdus sp. TaxID=1902408 RepID=UPI003BAF8336